MNQNSRAKLLLPVIVVAGSLAAMALGGELIIRGVEWSLKTERPSAARLEELPLPVAASGATYIVGLGDSYTFGIGVKPEETYLSQLEGLLAARYSGRSFQIANLGFPGHNTVQEREILVEILRRVKPAIIVLGFTLNDSEVVADYLKRTRGIGQKSIGERLRDVVNQSYLYGFLKLRVYELSVRLQLIEDDPETAYIKQLYDEAYPGWRMGREALRAIKQEADQHGAKLLVVIFPILARLDGDARYPFTEVHQMVAAYCAANGIDVLDLLPAFKGRDARALRVSLLDHHPNAGGHRLAAEAIADYMAAKGWLAPPPGA